MEQPPNKFLEFMAQLGGPQLESEEERKLRVLDEAQRGAKEAAQIVRSQREETRKALIEEGFPEDIADEMALDMVRAGIRAASGQD